MPAADGCFVRLPSEAVRRAGLLGVDLECVVGPGGLTLRPRIRGRAEASEAGVIYVLTEPRRSKYDDPPEVLAEWQAIADAAEAAAIAPAVELELDEGETLEPFTEQELGEFLDAPLDSAFEEAEWHGS